MIINIITYLLRLRIQDCDPSVLRIIVSFPLRTSTIFSASIYEVHQQAYLIYRDDFLYCPSRSFSFFRSCQLSSNIQGTVQLFRCFYDT